MTVPTPSEHDPDHPHAGSPRPAPGEQPGTGPAAPQPTPPYGVEAGYGGEGGPLVRRELREAAVCAVAVAVVGIAMGLLWLWLAPRVPLYNNGEVVLFKDPEGEQAIGAEGVFALLGLAFGAVSGLVLFAVRRRGGVGLVVGLALGGLLGSVLAWRVGVWFGPETDLPAAARAAGKGATFDAPLELHAYGMLLAWPVAATLVHLVTTALFGPRETPDAGAAQPQDWES
ncbi:hypothetical protein DTL70_16530 [Streptomyces diacarni]|uniref:ABC transporter permease n=1 Tax=Streptomyces diacarni TaxID=2800381 RepID=A0A367EXN5_9ACTN|nr:hypothetical protein [Streptomyces diacarni]RCG22157.1 hypothetical protein DTL70_16530 [Streptomyces diacarni]